MSSLVFIIDLSEPAPTEIMFNFYKTIAPNIHPRAIAHRTPNMILSTSVLYKITNSAIVKPAVFFDRDGVLNIESGYIHKVEDLHLIPGVAQAVRKLNDRKIFCCMVSNQSGPARDYYPVSHVEALHDRLCKLLENEAGAQLNALYYCPYLSASEGGTNPEFTRYTTWRKPNTGMLVAAAWEHDLDLRNSFMVGDKATDVDLAHNAGCRGILVQTGYGESVLKGEYQHRTKPDFIAADSPAAVEWILQQLK